MPRNGKPKSYSVSQKPYETGYGRDYIPRDVMHNRKLWRKEKHKDKLRNQSKPRLTSHWLADASAASSSRFPMASSSSIDSSLGGTNVDASAMPLYGGSAKSTKSWSLTILRIISLCWSFAKTSTALPKVVLSRERCPRRIRVIHSGLVCGRNGLCTLEFYWGTSIIQIW